MMAARLDQRVIVQRKSVTRDSVGGEVVTWSTLASRWAEAQPLRGREYVTLRAAQADVTIRFRLRHIEGLTPADRVMWRGKPYGIVDVIDVNGAREMTELMCRGDAADG